MLNKHTNNINNSTLFIAPVHLAVKHITQTMTDMHKLSSSLQLDGHFLFVKVS